MKTMNKVLVAAIAAAGLFGTALPAYAKLSAADAARLGADLTPVGAEKAGNKDGTIPAWTGGLCAPPAGWTAAKGYVDPFPNDKVKFTITAANTEQYKDNLTPGALAMLKVQQLQDAGVRDPSHRLLPGRRLRGNQGDGDQA